MKEENPPKVLVYGAGPLGSLFAARLQQGGNQVSLLARGQRLQDLRKEGIVLENVLTGERTVTEVDLVKKLAPKDAYDLVLVVMRKNSALEILPILAKNKHTPNVLFLGNNAAGSERYIQALGRERVLTGFPSAAGYREGPVVHCLAGRTGDPARVLFGEVDGRITERTRRVGELLDSAVGFETEIRKDMDAWLKYHVALLFPTLVPALYAAGTDRERLTNTRDLLVRVVRGIREGFRVLLELGYPVTPARYRVLLWLPEPLLVFGLKRLLRHELMEVALVRHAETIRDEARQLRNEFMSLAARTAVPTPNIEALTPYLDSDTPSVPEGRAEIPLRWGRLLTLVGSLFYGALAGYALVCWFQAQRSRE